MILRWAAVPGKHVLPKSHPHTDHNPDVTKWKTKGTWGEDPMKPIETQVRLGWQGRWGRGCCQPAV